MAAPFFLFLKGKGLREQSVLSNTVISGKGKFMSTTQPIRNQKQLQDFKNYYKEKNGNLRNYTLIVVGLNTALRINDILHLTWDTVFDGKQVRKHIFIREHKTGKENCIYLNAETRNVLKAYYRNTRKKTVSTENPYLFPSPRQTDKPLSRFQAYRIIRSAASQVDLNEHISCHSLRKTFGYHAWKQGVQPALLMTIYNHSSYRITMRYLCIEQDDKDEVFRNIRL